MKSSKNINKKTYKRRKIVTKKMGMKFDRKKKLEEHKFEEKMIPNEINYN
jgi:hypothetical protein